MNNDFESIFGKDLNEEEVSRYQQIYVKFMEIYEDIKDKNLNEIITEKPDSIILKLSSSEARRAFEIFLNLIADEYRVYSNMNYVIECLKKKYDNGEFWARLVHIIELSSKPYILTEFIRNMPSETKYNFFREIIENQILEVDAPENIIKRLNIAIDEEKIIIAVNMFNTLEDLVIVKRFSRSIFVGKVHSLFGLNEEDAIFLWSIITKNKTEFTNRYIINNLSNVMEIIQSLVTNSDVDFSEESL